MARLITWTYNPRSEPLQDVLNELNDSDLLFLIEKRTSLPVARIAWAEYGRRHGFIEFSISCVSSDSQVDVYFDGKPTVIHDQLIYDDTAPKM